MLPCAKLGGQGYIHVIYSCLLCHKLIGHIYVGLFLGCIFCSINLCVLLCGLNGTIY